MPEMLNWAAVNVPAYARDLDADHYHSMVCMNQPNSVSYHPLAMPHPDASAMFAHSMHGFIADIWTLILTRKWDKREKAIHLIWDEDIPKPTKLTSLFWLMVCESWPMALYANALMHDRFSPDAFQFQPFVMPASSHKLFATQYPPEFVVARKMMPSTALDQLLQDHMTREDRETMNKAIIYTQIHRPQVPNHVSYFQVTRSFIDSERWTDEEGWPTTPVASIDGGVANRELISSWWHLRKLEELRDIVMESAMTRIGIPTVHDALYTCPGGWIRQWSESVIAINDKFQGMPWTTDGAHVTIHSGITFPTVPPVAPRIWLGWTHHGPIYSVDEHGRPQRMESASSAWAQAYMQCRETALQMLFDPHSVDLETIQQHELAKRTRQLSNAGRLVESAGTIKRGNAAFVAAFKMAMGQNKGE